MNYIINYIKSMFYSTVIETPNTPPTFNFTHEQMNEIQAMLDRGDEWDKETQDKLDQDFETILGPELHAQFQQETQLIQDEFERELQDIFSSISHSGLDITTILEIFDLINKYLSSWF